MRRRQTFEYEYANGDPVNKVDPTGLDWTRWSDLAKKVFDVCKKLFGAGKAATRESNTAEAGNEVKEAEQSYSDIVRRLGDDDPSNDPTEEEFDAANERRSTAGMKFHGEIGKQRPAY